MAVPIRPLLEMLPVDSHRALKSARLLLITVFSLFVVTGCAGMFNREALRVNVVGIDPLDSQGLELRFNVRLRLQNPNETAVDYDGVSLDLEVNGQPLASGVSDQSGSVPRFGEALVSVPVTIPAFSAARQAIALANRPASGNLPYVLRGRLAGGVFGGVRFTDSGTLPIPGFGL
jgi:LEA14-like dessication related protein